MVSRVGAGTLAPYRPFPRAGPTSQEEGSSTHLALSLCPCHTAAGGSGEWGGARALWGAAWPKEYPRWAPGHWGLTPGASSRSLSTREQAFAAKIAAGSLPCKPPFKLEQQEVGTPPGIPLQGELRKWERPLWELKAVFDLFAKERFIRLRNLLRVAAGQHKRAPWS